MAKPALTRIAALVTLVTVCAGPVVASDESPIALVGGVVIDGHGGAPIENGVVVVRDGRIQAVGDVAAVGVAVD